MQPRIHYNGAQWVTADYKSAHKRTHASVSLWRHRTWHPARWGRCAFRGQRNSIMRNVRGLNGRGYRRIFAFSARCLSRTTFLNSSWQLRSSEAPVSFQLKPIHWEYRGKPADPQRLWRPSYPFPGDQGHIYRDLQRTRLQQMTIVPYGPDNSPATAEKLGFICSVSSPRWKVDREVIRGFSHFKSSTHEYVLSVPHRWLRLHILMLHLYLKV